MFSWASILTYVPVAISAASAAMAVLPQGAPGSAWANVRAVFNVVALNLGNAKNL